MMAEKVLYAELTPREFRERIAQAPIAYLPLGTLEWHGEHLPLGSDGLQSQGLFEQLARRAGGIVLPMLFLGPDRGIVHEGRELYGMDYLKDSYPRQQLAGSAYWIDNDGFQTLLDAVLKQLARAGFRIVVAHGHGPSTAFFRDRIPQWRERFGLQCFHCWHDDQGELGFMVDHAAANETSIMMALHPGLVHLENLDAASEQFPLGVSGRDPRTEASAEQGARIVTANLDRMTQVLQDAVDAVAGG